jgi:uncharacterized membrane protein YedE/YeeE
VHQYQFKLDWTYQSDKDDSADSVITECRCRHWELKFRMGELETTTIVGIGGFAVGLVFGAVVERTNFCTMGAMSDLVLMGDGRRFHAWVLAIAVAIIGTQALHFGAVVDINKSIYLTSNLGWLGATLGGAMFGVGMTLAGAAAAERWCALVPAI